MAIGDDFSVAVNGDIRHTANANHYHVLEGHRWLQDMADDQQASGDDLVDITTFTPSARSTDNIIELLDHSANGGPTFNIDDEAAEYFYGGSIKQNGGDELYSGLKVLGAVNNSLTQLMVIQDHDFYQYTTTPASPFWGDQSTDGYNGDSAGGVLMRILVKSRQYGADIDQKQVRLQARHWGDSYDFFNVTLAEGESVAALGTTPDAQNTTTQSTVEAYTQVTNSGGTADAPTGGYQLIDLNNGAGDQPYYSQWTFGTETDGLKALWEYGKDLTGNGTLKSVDGIGGELFLGITHDLNYNGETGGPFSEREVVVWGTQITYDTLAGGTFAAGDYVTIGVLGASGRIMYDDGATDMTVALDDPTIVLVDGDTITQADGTGAVTADINVTITDNGKFGGSGILLALNDGGTTGDIWLQLITGKAPVDLLPLWGVTSSAYAEVTGAPVARTIPKTYLGSYTGTMIGAFGIGVDPDDLTSSDSVKDLLDATQTPPNNQTFTVYGLVSGEDRVMVAPRTGVIIDYAQYTLSTTLSSGTETDVVLTGAILAKTNQTGVIRIQLDSGIRRYIEYLSWTGSTFTIASTDFSGDNATSGNTPEVYTGYIDKEAAATSESITMTYNADINLYVRVRDGGGTPIKTYESDTASFTATGGSSTASRIADY